MLFDQLSGRALSNSVCLGVAVNVECFSSLTKMFNCHQQKADRGKQDTDRIMIPELTAFI